MSCDFRDKPGGLIVDYLSLADQLCDAMATYTDSGGTSSPFVSLSVGVFSPVLASVSSASSFSARRSRLPLLLLLLLLLRLWHQNPLHRLSGCGEDVAAIMPLLLALSGCYIPIPGNDVVNFVPL